jgi:hypothetical protein
MTTIIRAQIDIARRLSGGPPGKAIAYISRMVIAALALCILAAISLIASVILEVNGEPRGVYLIVSMVLFAASAFVTERAMRLCKRIYDFDNYLSRAESEMAKLGAPVSSPPAPTEDPPVSEAAT